MKKRAKVKKMARVEVNDVSNYRAAVEVRMKKYDLTFEQAKRPEASTYIGRLFLRGKLSGEQYQAVQDFIELYRDYLQVIDAQGIYYEEGDCGGGDFEAYVQKKRQQYKSCLKFIEDELGDQYAKVMHWVIIRGMELPRFISAIEKICDALDKFFSEELTNKKNNLNMILPERYNCV